MVSSPERNINIVTSIFPIDRSRLSSSLFLPGEVTTTTVNPEQSNIDPPTTQAEEIEIDHKETGDPITIINQTADSGRKDTEMDTDLSDLNLSIQVQDLTSIDFLHGMTINVNGEEMGIDTILDLQEPEPTTAADISSLASSSLPPGNGHQTLSSHIPLFSWNKKVSSIFGFTPPNPSQRKSKTIHSQGFWHARRL